MEYLNVSYVASHIEEMDLILMAIIYIYDKTLEYEDLWMSEFIKFIQEKRAIYYIVKKFNTYDNFMKYYIEHGEFKPKY